jgi:hypothetical protein
MSFASSRLIRAKRRIKELNIEIEELKAEIIKDEELIELYQKGVAGNE